MSKLYVFAWYNGGNMAVNSSEIRVRTLHDQDTSDRDDFSRTTPAERLQMMWQLTVDAWAFKGERVAELRLPRHIVRVLRSEG